MPTRAASKSPALACRADRSGAASYLFIVPLFLCGVSKAAIMSASLGLLGQSRDNARQLQDASEMLLIAAQVQVYSHELALTGAALAAWPQGAASLNFTRAQLAAAADRMLSKHLDVLTGSKLPQTVNDIYFDSSCLRADGLCPSVTQDPALAPALYGLDSLIRAYVQAAQTLAALPAAQLSAAAPSFQFVYQVGPLDVRQGLQRVVSELDSTLSAALAVVSVTQYALIPFVLAGKSFGNFFLQPWLRLLLRESHRMAELLARLPREVDVEALVAQATGQT